MAAKSWLKIVGALKRFLKETGPLWPGSTQLSGYAEQGPYHCGDCKWLKKKDGKAIRDQDNHGRCSHPIVISDPEVPRVKDLAIVDIEHGCCEFVEYPAGFVEEAESEQD